MPPTQQYGDAILIQTQPEEFVKMMLCCVVFLKGLGVCVGYAIMCEKCLEEVRETVGKTSTFLEGANLLQLWMKPCDGETVC